MFVPISDKFQLGDSIDVASSVQNRHCPACTDSLDFALVCRALQQRALVCGGGFDPELYGKLSAVQRWTRIASSKVLLSPSTASVSRLWAKSMILSLEIRSDCEYRPVRPFSTISEQES